jgi:site-specific DNA-methyltransferase (adenine-specific)
MIEYFNEDCMAGMKRYPDGYFELAIVDPPYGIGESKKARENTKTDKWKAPKAKQHNLKNWDNNAPSACYFDELFRVSKNQIIWGANYFVDKLSMPSMGWIFWDKKNGDSDFSDGELAFTSFDKGLRKFEWLWNGFQKQKPESRIHPTQKPVALYKWLLTNYAKPGDKILDTHVGSASSLIACHDMGFEAVGFELDADYYRQSLQRLNDFMAQPRIDKLIVDNREQVELFGRPDYTRP